MLKRWFWYNFFLKWNMSPERIFSLGSLTLDLWWQLPTRNASDSSLKVHYFTSFFISFLHNITKNPAGSKSSTHTATTAPSNKSSSQTISNLRIQTSEQVHYQAKWKQKYKISFRSLLWQGNMISICNLTKILIVSPCRNQTDGVNNCMFWSVH